MHKMAKDDFDIKLKKIVLNNSNCSQNISPDEMFDDFNIVENLGFDSLGLIRLIVEIENNLNISFDESELTYEMISIYGNIRKYASKLYNEVNQSNQENDTFGEV